MHIRILDRYIFREVFMTFLFGICAFSAVFIGSRGRCFALRSTLPNMARPCPPLLKSSS